MASIVPSNTTTQLLTKDIGTDVYTSLKLPGEMVTLDGFFEGRTVAETMPQIFIDDCPTMTPDNSSICTWVINNDEANKIILTESSMVMQVRDASGGVVLSASELIAHGAEEDMTYSLNIYIKTSDDIINAGDYSAVIKL